MFLIPKLTCVHYSLALYQGSFSLSKAPLSLKDALDQYDIERANTKFGFPKDQRRPVQHPPENVSKNDIPTAQSTACSSGGQHMPTAASMAIPCNTSSVSAELLEGSKTYQILPSLPQTKPTGAKAIPEPMQEPPRKMATTIVVDSDDSATTTRSLQIPTKTTASSGRLDQEQFTLHTHHQSSEPPHPISNAATIPPPTPSDSLRSSPLFASDATFINKNGPVGKTFKHHSEDSMPPMRPQSSYGHGASRTSHPKNSSEGSNDAGSSTSRRCSIGDGLPIQGLPMVTPTPKYVVAGSTKRAHGASVSDIDPTHTKKISTNPYSGSSGIARQQK